MANDIFSAGQVMTVSVTGLAEAQRELTALAASLDPGSGGLRNLMSIAAGQVHRYILGLGRDRPPVGETGVLPVITGRLKNSLYWTVQAARDGINGLVVSNVEYGAEVEARREFMKKAARDMEQPVNDLFASYVRSRTR